MKDLYYKESGEIDKAKLVIGALVMIAIIAAMAFCYGLLMSFIPLIYFNILITAGFGMLLGLLVRIVDRLTNSRNIKTNYILAIIAVIAANYFQWDYFLSYVLSGGLMPSIGQYLSNAFTFLFNPIDTFSLIGEIKNIGTWGFGDSMVNGPFLALVWVGEMLLIALLTFRTAIDKHVVPFAEKANQWYPKFTIIDDFESVASQKLIEPPLIENPLQALESLGNGMGWRHSKIHLFFLPEETDQYLTIERIYIEDQGRGSTNREVVINNFRLTTEQAASIMERFKTKQEKMEVF